MPMDFCLLLCSELLPYLLLASLNCAFGLIRVYTFTTKYGTLLPCSERLAALAALAT